MTKIVTFYSYKGGVGRTMALVNTAHVLARDGWRVLMVDFDLEAPGMTHFFADLIKQRRGTVERDSLDLLLRAKDTLAANSDLATVPVSLEEYIVNVDLHPDWPDAAIPYKTGRLDLLPATLELRSSTESRDYLNRMGDLDLTAMFSKSGPQHRFGEHVRTYLIAARFELPGDPLFTLRTPIKAAYDIILLDSRTGLNEIAGLCIGPICDAIIICTGLNAQNIAGTRYFMTRAGLLSNTAKPYAVAAGPIPGWHTRQAEAQLARIRSELKAKIVVEIPYHPAAAISETVFVTAEPKDPITKAYESLAPVIVEFVRNDPDEQQGLSRLERIGSEQRVIQDLAPLVGKNLALLRIQDAVRWTLPPSLATFPTAITMSAVPRRNVAKGVGVTAADVQGLPIAAAICAYEGHADAGFVRARSLLPTVAEKDLRRDLAVRLLYFQFRTLGVLPRDDVGSFAYQIVRNVIGPEESSGDVPHRDARSVLYIDALMTALLLFAGGRGDALRIPESVIRDQLARLSDGAMASRSRLLFQAWLDFTSPATVLRPDVLQAISKPEPDKRERQALERLLEQIQLPNFFEESSSDAYEREFYGRPYRRELLPVGLWPESVIISALALTKPKDVRTILRWVTLARHLHGYAWRVIVDWRHLRALKGAPHFESYLAHEDELARRVEKQIDTGVFPL